MSDPGIAYGSGSDPNLPPVNLPTFDDGSSPAIPQITINARPRQPDNAPPVPLPPPRPAIAQAPAAPDVDYAASAPGYGDEALPATSKTGAATAPSAAVDYAASAPDYSTVAEKSPEKPARTIDAAEGASRGAMDMLTFGLAPAIAGAANASGMPSAAEGHPEAIDINPIRPLVGAYKMLDDWMAGHKDPAIAASYEQGRQDFLNGQVEASKQQPYSYLAGQLAGALIMPMGELGAPAAAGARILKGAKAGGLFGGLYGVGTGVSNNESPGDIAIDATKDALGGAVTGGLISGAIGPRVASTGPGARAAQTAADIGAPLPRGLASDSPFVQATTQQASQIPVVGGRISARAAKTVKAAGEEVQGIAQQLSPNLDRASADIGVRPGLERVIENNKADIDAAYNGVRNSLDLSRVRTMPRTRALLTKIKQDRAAAGWPNPSLGLEQFENVAEGATFNGAHRARVDARSAGDVLNPHPGYDKGDFNRLTEAMTADIRQIVYDTAKGNVAARVHAVRAFDAAEKTFGLLADENTLVNRLLNAKGEGAIATLLNAAKERGGNLRLLAQMRNAMPSAKFEQISGLILNELGMKASTGEFSLNQFVTGWNKLSDGAKDALFGRNHRLMIEDIVNLGQHLKGGDQFKNTSNTAGAIILWDIARAVGEFGVAAAAGLVSPLATAGVVGTALAAEVLTRILASPAKAAALSAWVRAYRGVLGTGAPARTAIFKIATRNLASTLGIPAEKIMGAIQARLPLAAQPADQQQPKR